MSSDQIPTQLLGQGSEMHVGSSGVCLPPSSFAKQFTIDSSARPQVASGGVARNKFLSKPYPFTGNSGTGYCSFIFFSCDFPFGLSGLKSI